MKRVLAAGFLVAWIACGSAAAPLSVRSLQTLLQSAPAGERRFEETRHSPWLKAPVVSSGRMLASGDQLEKRIEQPKAETWIILPDRMRVSRGVGAAKEVLLERNKAAAAMATALRLVVSGNVSALENDFVLTLSGEESTWTVLLNPRQQEVARHLQQIELRGAGARLHEILLVETKGERTLTKLMDP